MEQPRRCATNIPVAGPLSSRNPSAGRRSATGAGASYGMSMRPDGAGPRRLRADRAPQVAAVLRQRVVTATRHTLRVGPAEGLGHALAAHGQVTNVVRVRRVLKPPTDVGEALGLAAGGDAVYIERLRLLDGTPLSLDFTYLPADVGRALLRRADLADRDLYGLVEQASGRSLGDTDTRVEATVADSFVASVLEVRRGAPILLLRRLTFWADGEPADVEYLHMRGDSVAVLFRNDH